MKQSFENILRKINYIEAEIEIQKQIAFSIPETEKSEIKKTLTKIAESKKEVAALRKILQETSPEEYQKIIAIEESLVAFENLQKSSTFKNVESLDSTGVCQATLPDGQVVDCLVKAQDEQGLWTIITLDGKIVTFSDSQIKPTS